MEPFEVQGSPFETRRDAAPQGERIENSEREPGTEVEVICKTQRI